MNHLKCDLDEIDAAVESVMPRHKDADECYGCGCIMASTTERAVDLARAYAKLKAKQEASEAILRRLIALHNSDHGMETDDVATMAKDHYRETCRISIEASKLLDGEKR